MRIVLLAVLAAIVLGGVARTGYRRGWYGRYNDGVPDLDGWGGLKLGAFALLLLLFVLVFPALHLGMSKP